MKLTMIAAIGKNRELGKNNDLIWHLPKDLKFFREQTKEHTIVMGRKTFESLPGLLPKRHHIVISRSNPCLDKSVELFNDIDAFMKAYQENDEEIFVIGGAQIYSQMLPFSTKLILTEIDESCNADVYFPEFDKSKYQKNVINDITENDIHYKHVVYERIN